MPAPSARALFTTSLGSLALGLLAVELLAGIQSYLTAVVTPLMAAELDGQHLYGVLTASTQAAMFLTMPLGVALLRRAPGGRLLVWFTGVTVVGALVSAIAPTAVWFAAGRVIAALAAGALATISMGVIVTVLPRQWRQLVLAGFSAMWVITSLVGPAYAAWASEQFGWRWAMVGYLPLLIVARLLVARRLRESGGGQDAGRLSMSDAVVLAAGVALIAAPIGNGWSRVVAVGAALALTAFAGIRLLPSGVARLRSGRPSAIAALGLLCGVYFGASGIVAILAHDVLGYGAVEIGALLSGGGLAWAIVGLACGRRPAASDQSYRVRVTVGSALVTAGLALQAVAVALAGAAWSGLAFAAGWILAGLGMGSAYLDTIGRIVEPPAVEDGIAAYDAAAASVAVEMIATAAVATAVASGTAYAISALDGSARLWVLTGTLALLAVGALLLAPVARRAAR